MVLKQHLMGIYTIQIAFGCICKNQHFARNVDNFCTYFGLMAKEFGACMEREEYEK
jgi:hypothetical protein